MSRSVLNVKFVACCLSEHVVLGILLIKKESLIFKEKGYVELKPI